MEHEIELAVEKIEQLNARNQMAMMELIKKSLKMNDEEFNRELLLAYAHRNPVHILEIAIALQYEEMIKALPERFG
ncbi:hypothetical protein [Paenibacillus xerothermodurans]|uniref:Uncharacterized protein n=1 Tax=Paenibacillus xerothermodurans TaxID=1977292 RepID=A0A2W1NV04_PAEXE|nr:hypothetical protein [Paenibacillus xerothermodurans]PZE21596.1 hypothetical protein CBW46_003975 [Paenibacillus xerothermodurans]